MLKTKSLWRLGSACRKGSRLHGKQNETTFVIKKKIKKNVVASFGEAIKKDILSYLSFKVTMIEIYGWVAEGHPLKAPVFCKALTNASIEFVPPFLFSHPTVSSCFFFFITTYVFLG